LALRQACDEFGQQVVADWWKMNDEMLLTFGDGWVHDWGGSGSCQPVAYPREWLEGAHFFRKKEDRTRKSSTSSTTEAVSTIVVVPPPPPKTKLWTLEEKLLVLKNEQMRSESNSTT